MVDCASLDPHRLSLLTLVALVYTLLILYAHQDQMINVALASTLDNDLTLTTSLIQPMPGRRGFGSAVLRLPLVSDNDRSDIQLHLATVKGMEMRCVPMLVHEMAVPVRACLNSHLSGRAAVHSRGAYGLTQDTAMSA